MSQEQQGQAEAYAGTVMGGGGSSAAAPQRPPQQPPGADPCDAAYLALNRAAFLASLLPQAPSPRAVNRYAEAERSTEEWALESVAPFLPMSVEPLLRAALCCLDRSVSMLFNALEAIERETGWSPRSGQPPPAEAYRIFEEHRSRALRWVLCAVGVLGNAVRLACGLPTIVYTPQQPQGAAAGERWEPW